MLLETGMSEPEDTGQGRCMRWSQRLGGLVEHLNPSDGHWGQVPVTFPEMSAKAKLSHVVGTSHLWESKAESWLAGLLGGAESDLKAVDI